MSEEVTPPVPNPTAVNDDSSSVPQSSPANRFTITTQNKYNILYTILLSSLGSAITYTVGILPQINFGIYSPQAAIIVPVVISVMHALEQFISPY